MELINVRSDNPSSIQKMKKHFSDPNKTIIAAIVADWCGACQQFKPIWEATTKNYIASQSPSKKKKQLILATIQDSTAHEFNIHDIKGFPTIRVIKNNTTMHERLGGMPEEHLVQHIEGVAKTCPTISPKKTNKKPNTKTKRNAKKTKTAKRKTTKRKTTKRKTAKRKSKKPYRKPNSKRK
jgi:thiol-disulfide isomerase/thioredoxin